MRRSFLTFLMLANILLFAGYSSFCSAEETSQGIQTKYENGKVAAIDIFNKEITINVTGSDGKITQIKFVIDQHTKILKKDLLLSLTDIRAGDEVIVEYLVDPMSFSSQRASRIRVKALNEESQGY
jgi:hypothetical protein